MRKIKTIIAMILAMVLLVASTACGSVSPDIPSEPVPESTSQEGDSSVDVATLQQYLASLGFFKSAVTGEFDVNTKNAVLDFQTIYGLNVSGEADEETLDMLKMVTDALSLDEKNMNNTITMFKNVDIILYKNGTYYVAPNTVSDTTMENAENALKAVINAYKNSTSIPGDDIRILIEVDEVPNGLFESELIDGKVDLGLVSSLTNHTVDGISFTDSKDNEITVLPDGSYTSDTGIMSAELVDYDSGKVLMPLSDINVDEYPVNVHEGYTDRYCFRTIILWQMGDKWEADTDIVSDTTLDEFRKAYTAIRYAYYHSNKIPVADIETRIQVDVNNLPEGITLNDLMYDDATGIYYITTRQLQSIAKRSGEAVTISDSEGNEITVDRTGNTESNTGNMVAQNADAETGTTEAEFESQTVDNIIPETRESEPVTTMPEEPIEVVENPTQPSNPSNPTNPTQPENPTNPTQPTTPAHEEPTTHVHDWVAITTVVHHDAITHEETVYKTVHHDEEGHWETKVISEAWDEPNMIALCVVVCHLNVPASENCYQEFASTDSYEAKKMWSAHNREVHNGKASYFCDSRWVEDGTYTHHDAVTEEVWVVDEPAWDETVITGYSCSICGETKPAN